MRLGENDTGEAPLARRGRRPQRRRNWLLISACVLLVLLAAVLWGNWRTSRRNAENLEAELKKVYIEAEKLRLDAALAQQRIGELEQQMKQLAAERDRAAESRPRPSPAPPPRR